MNILFKAVDVLIKTAFWKTYFFKIFETEVIGRNWIWYDSKILKVS